MHKPRNTNSSLAAVEPGMRRPSLIALLCLISCLALANTKQSVPVLRYVSVVVETPQLFIVDTRAQQRCEHNSLAGAHCLPASDLIGPHGELPSFADIYWLLGTLGLDGSEHVLVTGANSRSRDYVAALLYLCGQSRISVLSSSLDTLLSNAKYRTGSGIPRAILRKTIYRAVMRDQALLLPGELKELHEQGVTVVMENASPSSVKNSRPVLASMARAIRTQPGLHVVYAEHLRDAITAFGYLLALNTTAVSRIKVMPVDYPSKIKTTTIKTQEYSSAINVSDF